MYLVKNNRCFFILFKPKEEIGLLYPVLKPHFLKENEVASINSKVPLQ